MYCFIILHTYYYRKSVHVHVFLHIDVRTRYIHHIGGSVRAPINFSYSLNVL
jgi:hypothetical protein